MRDHSPTRVKHSPSEPAEIPVRSTAQAETRSPRSDIGRNANQLSPPLPWPRVNDAEVARRAQLVDTAVSFPYRKPVVGAAVPKPLVQPPEIDPDSAAEQQEPRLELVSISPPAQPGSVQSGLLTELSSRFHNLKLASIPLIFRKIGRAPVFTRVEVGANRGVQSAVQGLAVLRQKSGYALDAAKRGWVNGSKAVLSESRSGVQRLWGNVRGIDSIHQAQVLQRARALRVTIRIPASNWRFLSSLSKSARAWGAQVHRNLRRDSQLWASIAMAGLSALLALGVISALRHYDSEKGLLPTTQETVDAAVPSPAIPAPSPSVVARESASQKPSPLADRRVKDELLLTRPAPAKAQRKAMPSTASKKPRHRRKIQEDDYVAADTYVFYGSGGKPKR